MMSAFPLSTALGNYMTPNLATTQLLMSAVGAGSPPGASPTSAGSKDVSSPTSLNGLHLFPRIPSMQDYTVAGQPCHPYLPPFVAADPAILYSALNGIYENKDNADAFAVWQRLAAQAANVGGFMPYEQQAAAAMAASFSYPGYPGMDLNNARRKNATRETTSTLKAWLYEHRKNPYPTKGEKIMLAIITKMTLTQVSTWFANARRRLKKENKMTWSPRNRTGDGSSVDGDESKEGDDAAADVDDVSIDLSDFEDDKINDKRASPDTEEITESVDHKKSELINHRDSQKSPSSSSTSSLPHSSLVTTKDNHSKPRIWSIADMAASKPILPHHSTPTASIRHRPYPAPVHPAAFRPWFDAATYRQMGIPAFANPLFAARPTIPAATATKITSPNSHDPVSPVSRSTNPKILSSKEDKDVFRLGRTEQNIIHSPTQATKSSI